jgi:GDPmannose 4,6-dehydratase
MSKRALITGVCGMDGSHMADLLLSKGYEVFGLERHKSAGGSRKNIKHILDKITLVKGDLSDISSLMHALEIAQPDEIYNFAAQSFVGDSWIIAEHTGNITGLGVLRILEAMKAIKPNARLAQASSSEMFGKLEGNTANELSRFYPKNPYAVAKVFGHQIVQNYRDSYGLFVCSSMCFNHESERRSLDFVTRKISNGVARIKCGLDKTISLGLLDARRDWGYAPEYVRGIWSMLQIDSPQDFVFATGESYTVEYFVKTAFQVIGISNWQEYVQQDPRFIRPVEVDYLKGDYSKATSILDWKPEIKLNEIIRRMVINDINILENSNGN